MKGVNNRSKRFLRAGLGVGALVIALLMLAKTVGGPRGLHDVFVIALLALLALYFMADRWVLWLYGAEQVTSQSAPLLHSLAKDVARRASIPTPSIYIVRSALPNAFSIGRSPKQGAIVVTSGLLQLLAPYELKGVIAHEVSHIQSRDTLIMAFVASVFGGAASLIGWICRRLVRWVPRRLRVAAKWRLNLMPWFAPILGKWVALTVASSREFDADEAAVRLIGESQGLASALEKMEEYATSRSFEVAEGNPATAHMFIINPVRVNLIQKYIDTHPDTGERVRRLREMSFL